MENQTVVLRRLEDHEAGMTEVLRRLEELNRRGRSPSRDGEEGMEENDGASNDGRNKRRPTPNSQFHRRLEIPIFTGEDAFGWLSKVERYFMVNRITEAEKVGAVLVVLEGEALHWYQWWEVNNPRATWGIFRLELLSRFQPEVLDNPYRALYVGVKLGRAGLQGPSAWLATGLARPGLFA